MSDEQQISGLIRWLNQTADLLETYGFADWDSETEKKLELLVREARAHADKLAQKAIPELEKNGG